MHDGESDYREQKERRVSEVEELKHREKNPITQNAKINLYISQSEETEAWL